MHNEDKLHFRVRPTEPTIRVRGTSLPAATVRRGGRVSPGLTARNPIRLRPGEVPGGQWPRGPAGIVPVHRGSLGSLHSHVTAHSYLWTLHSPRTSSLCLCLCLCLSLTLSLSLSLSLSLTHTHTDRQTDRQTDRDGDRERQRQRQRVFHEHRSHYIVLG